MLLEEGLTPLLAPAKLVFTSSSTAPAVLRSSTSVFTVSPQRGVSSHGEEEGASDAYAAAAASRDVPPSHEPHGLLESHVDMTDGGAGEDGWHALEASDAPRDHPRISSTQSGMTCTGHESRQDSNGDVGHPVVGHPSNASECNAWETSKVWEECGMDASASKACASAATPTWTKGKVKVPGSLRSLVGDAVREFEMIGEGDKVLVGVSGGKDSLTMLHVLLELQRRSPLKFDIAAATVDPQTPEYDPSALVSYMEHLGVRYRML